MSKYRKKPVIIEAIQWFKQGDHPEVVSIPDKYQGFAPVLEGAKGIIKTLEGDVFVIPGDWIIQGVEGEYYPCKPDIFGKTYDRVKKVNIYRIMGWILAVLGALEGIAALTFAGMSITYNVWESLLGVLACIGITGFILGFLFLISHLITYEENNDS